MIVSDEQANGSGPCGIKKGATMRFYTKKQLEDYLEDERIKLNIARNEYELQCGKMRIQELYLEYFEKLLGVKFDGSVSVEEIDKRFREKTAWNEAFNKDFHKWYGGGFIDGGITALKVCQAHGLISEEKLKLIIEAFKNGAEESIKKNLEHE